ncbi:MAG: hypothetical protein AAGI07_15505, partial [Bacteroidota bacterium]
INTPQLCYVYNYALNKRENASTELIDLLEKLIAVQENFVFIDYLKFALGNIYYYKGELGNALNLLEDVYFSSSRTNPDFANFLGGWMIQLGEYEKAASYFNIAYKRGKEDAILNEAIALSEFKNKDEAIEKWKRVAEQENAEWGNIANDMLRFLVKDSLTISELILPEKSDFLRYRFLHYNQNISEKDFEAVYQSISTEEIRVVIAVERVKWGIEMKNELIAGKYMKLLATVKMNDEVLPLFQEAYLKYIVFQGKLDKDFFEKVQETNFNRFNKSEQYYFSALYHAAFLQEEQAVSAFEKAVALNPTKEDYFLEWAAYYQEIEKPEKAYEVLLEGVTRNEDSSELTRAYIIQALNLRYTSFAESMLEELAKIESETRYQEFLKVYNQKLAEVEKVFEDWEN